MNGIDQVKKKVKEWGSKKQCKSGTILKGGKCVPIKKEVSTLDQYKPPKKKKHGFWNPKSHHERGSGPWGYLKKGTKED